MADDAGESITVGRIDAAYGVKGWVKVFSYTDPVERIFEYTPWQLVRRGKVQRLEIADSKIQGRGLIALPAGYEDRTQAELLVGSEIRIDKNQLPALDEGEFYWHELEGLVVINAEDDNLGIVDHLLETGSNDVMVVKATESSIDDRERLIPWLEDQVVKQVDRERGRIVVDWPADY
ncbi:MAG TPA: ribosome maturation factor RimM [Pseudomonadales bacterium]|nr:ribosome maturation factor RimM [Pseudomonadales bacterium]